MIGVPVCVFGYRANAMVPPARGAGPAVPHLQLSDFQSGAAYDAAHPEFLPCINNNAMCTREYSHMYL